MRPLLLPALWMLALSVALLAARAAPPVLRSDAVLAEQRALREALEQREGRYGALPADRRERIVAAQATLSTLLAGTRDTDDLDPARRGQVFAALAAIDAELDAPGEDRVVCRREAKTGSNVMVRVCRSARQLREDEDTGRSRLEEARRSTCNDRHGCY
ncbi:MAG TPA: hypothetical protein VM619_03590 [Luteimonas sp.]|nr:hypothetical protein [Luteimonas sp.]